MMDRFFVVELPAIQLMQVYLFTPPAYEAGAAALERVLEEDADWMLPPD
jgi:hypothetical protein